MPDNNSAPIEHWDSIIAHHESVVKGYERELAAYYKAVFSKKRKGNLNVEKRILKTIDEHKLTLKVLKANRKRLFGA